MDEDELALLQTYVNAGDRAGYYSYLATLGDTYAPLAAGVVTSDALSGYTANAFLANVLSNVGITCLCPCPPESCSRPPHVRRRREATREIGNSHIVTVIP